MRPYRTALDSPTRALWFIKFCDRRRRPEAMRSTWIQQMGSVMLKLQNGSAGEPTYSRSPLPADRLPSAQLRSQGSFVCTSAS